MGSSAGITTIKLLASLIPMLLLLLGVLIIIFVVVVIVRLYKAVIRTADATEETNRLLRILIKDLREKNETPASSESSSSESV